MRKWKRRKKRRLVLTVLLVIGGLRLLTWNGGAGNILKNGMEAVSERISLGQDQFLKNEDGTYPDQLVELAKKNRETRQFVKDYPENAGKKQKIKLTNEDLKGNQGSSVPLLVQWDERWGYRKYGNDFMALTGCGPTCLAMVAESRGETKWNPWRVAKMAQRNGYYVDGQGSAWSLMTEGAAKMGLNGTEMSCDAETIRRTLEDGHVIICAMRPGDFTTAGHFLVLAGVTQDGEVIINDPNSRKNSRRTWDLERVVPQIKNLWKYS
jgi:hypothetical protein